MQLNPFHEDFATETTSPADFVRLFSPKPLSLSTDVLSLFRTGNVVLTGVQGCGKSMLLALLSTDIRLAYEAAGVAFPVPTQISQFISAGINLTHSGAPEFGQRSIDSDPTLDKQWPLYFGDFVNYWVVRDLIATIVRYRQPDGTNVAKQLALNLKSDALNNFAQQLSKHECWSGYLAQVSSFEALRTAVGHRLRVYRDYLNYNCSMPSDISESKTTAGEPVSVASELLRTCNVIREDTQVFVRIDQYEELTHLEEWSRKKDLFHDYRAIIHKMLGRRDGRVHYRIGTRRYAWPESPQMFSTNAVVENLRNYTVIDLDDLLRRKENLPWVFPEFADDVFRRRLVHAGFPDSGIAEVFGAPLTANEKAKRYVKDSEKIIECEEAWPQGCCDALHQIAKEDALSAKLGEAHLRQALDRGDNVNPEVVLSRPWDSRMYWKKDRVDQALLQIAASSKQKMLWSGNDDILALAAGNMLVFLDICKAIWAAWLRSTSKQDEAIAGTPPQFTNPYIQDEGIQQVSAQWFEKIRASERGDSRMRFARSLGNMFRRLLREDKNMSYPGYNGFSLPAKELESDEFVKRFLNEATAFGVLVCKRHTPRSKGRGDSLKWYLHPVLCPYFQIPVAHRKEPKEVHVTDVQVWLDGVGVIVTASKKPESSPSLQRRLFNIEEQE